MREVARSRNLLSGFVTTLKRLFESVVGTLFCLVLDNEVLLASEASETLLVVVKWKTRYVYTYIYIYTVGDKIKFPLRLKKSF